MDKERVWNDTRICHFKAEIYHNQTEFTPTTSVPAFPICWELCIASLSENSTFPEFSLHAASNNNIRFKSMFVLPYHLLHLQLQAGEIPTTGPLNTEHIQRISARAGLHWKYVGLCNNYNTAQEHYRTYNAAITRNLPTLISIRNPSITSEKQVPFSFPNASTYHYFPCLTPRQHPSPNSRMLYKPQ